MSTGNRRKGREAALQMLYQLEVMESQENIGELPQVEGVIQMYWAHLSHSVPGQQGDEGRDFADELVRLFGRNRDEIDERIRKQSHNWRMERMTRVDRNLLRLGVTELVFVADVPKRVTLNEAVELAKRFGNENSGSFVNGVLDRIAESLDKVDPTGRDDSPNKNEFGDKND